MREVSIRDLIFARVPVTCYTPAGVPYIRWMNAGMPKISQAIFKSAFFLFKNKDAALTGLTPGGTGFIVSVPSEEHPDGPPYYYAVSCLHVVHSSPCVRLNKKEAGTDLLDFIFDEWAHDYETYGDVAAIMINADALIHDASAIPLEMFLSPERMVKHEIGVGEDVFMVGLFVDIDRELNREKNNPMARFGHISMMPSPSAKFRSSRNFRTRREFFLLDVHSRRGFSGSPAFVYRAADNDVSKSHTAWLSGYNLLNLVGIHCAQFSEYWPFRDGSEPGESQIILGKKTEGESRVVGLSGITMVAPAWDIANLLLNSERLREERGRLDKEGRPDIGVILESPTWGRGEEPPEGVP